MKTPKLDEGLASETFSKGAAGTTREDMDDVLGKKKRIWDLASKLGELAGKAKMLWAMIKDYKDGNYKDVPWKVIASIVFALAYFLSPIDLIPDFILGVGYIDDAFIIGLVLKMFSDQIEAYEQWKKAQSDGNVIVLD